MIVTVLQTFAETEEAGIAALGIDPLAILAQAATFLLLFVIIKKLALGKISATLEARRKTIDDGVRLGIKMEKRQTEFELEIEKQLHETRLKADALLADANQQAGALIKEAEVKAGEKVDLMIQNAHAKIEQDIQKAKKGLEHEMISLVAAATEVIIGDKLDAQKDAAVIEKALAGAGTKNG